MSDIWLIHTRTIMTLISIGRAQRLLASLEQSCTHVGLPFQGTLSIYESSLPVPVLFCLLSSLCPFWLVYPMQISLPSTVKTHSYSIPIHLRSYGHILWDQHCPSANLVAIPTCCQPPQDTTWVVNTGIGELPLCILAAWGGWVAGSAKSSTKKTLSPLSFQI